MAEQKKTTALATSKKIDDQVLERVEQLAVAGFTMPKDFNYVNAVKMSMLKLKEVKDKNGKPALEVCDQASIATALFKMCTKGLNIALNQAYAIVRGNQLCIDPSYFGNVLQVKRIFPNWEPHPHSIREGDVFEFAVDTKTGRRKLVKHEQTLSSMDSDFVGGYIILPTNDGEGDLYVMTKKQILAAWSKSSNTSHSVAKEFQEKMINKTLINSGCTIIINSTPSLNTDGFDETEEEEVKNNIVEEQEVEVINEDTGEVVDLDKTDEPQPEEVKEQEYLAEEAEENEEQDYGEGQNVGESVQNNNDDF